MTGWAGLEHIKSGEAGAVLTAWRSMISSVPQEYDEVAREIERAGGFLHVKDSAYSERGVAAVTRRRFRYAPFTIEQDQTAEPEYAARCVSGDETECGAESGTHSGPGLVEEWQRRHTQETGHRRYRRTFGDYAVMRPRHNSPNSCGRTGARRDLRPGHCVPVALPGRSSRRRTTGTSG